MVDPMQPAAAGQRLDLGNGANFEVRLPGGVWCIPARLANFRALLPFGMSFDDLEELDDERRVGLINVLRLGDHGYAPAHPPEWIANLHLQLLLLSVTAGDEHGRPDRETLVAPDGHLYLTMLDVGSGDPQRVSTRGVRLASRGASEPGHM